MSKARLITCFMIGALANVSAVETNPASAETDSTTGKKADPIENSVVQIHSTLRYPDTYKPWMKQSTTEATGSGVVISGHRILTCAHVVSYASQVQVQASQSSDLVTATVEAIAPGMDLAVLKLQDTSFFETHRALELATNLPDVGDSVMAYGFPLGGKSLSITKGIVSRIEFVAYNGATFGLRVQIDAAINHGNSGGPAMAGNKIVGLACSVLTGAQSVGYIIPCEELQLFLSEIEDGKYQGKPMLAEGCQGLVNPALRSYLHVDKSVKGVLVSKPFSKDPSYPLKENDIITKIGDMPLDDEGMVQAGPDLRVFFKYFVQKLQRNGKVPLTLWNRSTGKSTEVEVPVIFSYPQVMPDLAGSYPPYFVYGPLVFSAATVQFLNGFGAGTQGAYRLSLLSSSGSPLVERMGDIPAFDGEQLVVISSSFPHKIAAGYGSLSYQVVNSVNGIRIRNLKHLVEVLRDSKDEFIVIKFQARFAQNLVFRRQEMLDSTEDILADNSIRSQGSPDTMAVWNLNKQYQTDPLK